MRGRPKEQSDLKPVSAFNKNALRSGDRETGSPISASELKTHTEALAQYHLRPESKFLDGDFRDRRRTKRRHVMERSSPASARKPISGKSGIFSARMTRPKSNTAEKGLRRSISGFRGPRCAARRNAVLEASREEREKLPRRMHITC
jgi:hypothetical protein